MGHIRKFDSFTKKRKLTEVIKEQVMIVNDIYKVRATVDIPQSLLNQYIKKVKDNTDKNVRQLYSDSELAEEITKVVLQRNLDIEKLSPDMIFGDGGSDTNVSKDQTNAEDQSSTEEQPHEQQSTEEQPQEQNDDFEEVKSDDSSNQDNSSDENSEGSDKVNVKVDSAEGENKEDKELPI